MFKINLITYILTSLLLLLTFSNNNCLQNYYSHKDIRGTWKYEGLDDPVWWSTYISETLVINEDYSFYQTEYIDFLFIDTAAYCARLWGHIEILNSQIIKFNVDSASPNELKFDRDIPFKFNNDDTLHIGIYYTLGNEKLYKFVRAE
jgi:hypothetical protein